MKFVKYINHRSLARLNKHPNRRGFWDFSFVYYEWWCIVATVTENSGGGGQVPTQKFSSDLSPDKLCSCNSITLHNVRAGGFFNCKNENCNTLSTAFNALWMRLSHNRQLSSCSHGSSTVASLTHQGENYCTLPKVLANFIKKKKKKGNGSVKCFIHWSGKFCYKMPRPFSWA